MSRKLVLMLTLTLLIGTLSVAFNVQRTKASGSIYIRADGSIDPPTTPISTVDNVTYTFTHDIRTEDSYISIFVLRSNIVIDGSGHTLRAFGVIGGAGFFFSNNASNITIKNTDISGFDYAVVIGSYSSNNSVFGNNITNNREGIVLLGSSNNRIVGNNITANSWEGIDVASSFNNSIYHNNFVDNRQQFYSYNATNNLDDGYPSGGNYWSDYNGTDTNHDGIGDSSYVIAANNTDHYPLMGMFNSYNVTYYTPPLVPHFCNVTVISNSTISDFVAPVWIEHPEVIFLQFNVSGAEGSIGFCRISFPVAMMSGTYHVSVNGTEISYTLLPCSDANYSYLYFSYTHSTQEVIIIPEFSSFLVLPIFMLTILLAVVLYRKKREKLSPVTFSS